MYSINARGAFPRLVIWFATVIVHPGDQWPTAHLVICRQAEFVTQQCDQRIGHRLVQWCDINNQIKQELAPHVRRQLRLMGGKVHCLFLHRDAGHIDDFGPKFRCRHALVAKIASFSASVRGARSA